MPTPLRFIILSEVLLQTGLSKTTVYTLPGFPRPVKIGGAAACAQGGVRWVEHEVQDWMQSRIDCRKLLINQEEKQRGLRVLKTNKRTADSFVNER